MSYREAATGHAVASSPAVHHTPGRIAPSHRRNLGLAALLCWAWLLSAMLTPAHAITASATVTNTSDSGSGSLRDAVEQATTSGGNTTIVFQNGVSGTINVGAEMVIGNNAGIAITGPATAPGIVLDGGDSERIFTVSGGATLVLTNLWLTRGVAQGAAGQFDINTYPNGGGGGGGQGGAIYNSGTLNLESCTFSANSARGGQGGPGGQTFSGFPGGQGGGGGPGQGGAIYSPGETTAANCTFNGNSASGGQGGAGGDVGAGDVGGDGGLGGNGIGGAIAMDLGGIFILIHSTLSNNSALGGDGGPGGQGGAAGGFIGSPGNSFGGAIDGTNTAGPTARNTIIAGNSASNGPDVYGNCTSSDYNLVGNTTNINFSATGPHDLLNVPPGLDTLKNYGGPVPTMALLGDSPALDAGGSGALTADARGATRPLDLPGVSNADNGSDIGAFEVQFSSISGLVRTRGGTPLAGVSVAVSPVPAGVTSPVTTNSSGQYLITGLPPGLYFVTPTLSGFTFSPASQGLKISNANRAANFVGTNNNAYRIIGRVSDSGGVAIANVNVAIIPVGAGVSSAVTTNSAGYYTFTGVIDGTYNVTPSKAGFTFAPPNRTVIVNGADSTGNNFIGSTGKKIIGRLATSGGMAIANASVALSPVPAGATSPVTSNSAGYFTFNNVPNGNYTVTPTKAGFTFTPPNKPVSVTNADQSGLNFIGSGP